LRYISGMTNLILIYINLIYIYNLVRKKSSLFLVSFAINLKLIYFFANINYVIEYVSWTNIKYKKIRFASKNINVILSSYYTFDSLFT